MADRRPEEQEMSRAKRPRTGDLDPAKNPYLSHMYEVQDNDSYSNGFTSRNGNGFSSSNHTGLSNFKRHETTALQAHTAEDGPNNPFNNAPLSQQYFNILKTRRDLPVHKQRQVTSDPTPNHQYLILT
jgi:pre-mRNA-splicing factor ATP-dependent RNA helicase DHX15/PRP43